MAMEKSYSVGHGVLLASKSFTKKHRGTMTLDLPCANLCRSSPVARRVAGAYRVLETVLTQLRA